MNGDDPDVAVHAPLAVHPFPWPPHPIELLYEKLDQAANGTDEQRQEAARKKLPRPWIPSTVDESDVHSALRDWLILVVEWINHEHTSDPADLIPTCWESHPHLVQELAVIADQRFRAEVALISEPLATWQRRHLPEFRQRMREQLHGQCDEGHVSPRSTIAGGNLRRSLAVH